MHKIYDSILRAISKQDRVQDLESYLQSLQPYVGNLREAYRSYVVSIDYSNFNIQVAYLLAYYPLYVEMTYKILRELFQNNYPSFDLQTRKLQACFLGGGPVPEAVALSIYLREIGFQVETIVAQTFDIAASAWSRSREISKDLVSELSPEIQFFVHGHQMNLCRRGVLTQCRDIIETSNLFIVQNCLNEFAGTPQIFVENINFLVQEMPVGSILILADLNQYAAVNNLIRRVESCLLKQSGLQVIRSHDKGDCYLSTNLELPTVITRNLLTGANNLKPRKRVNFNYLAIQKLPIAVQPDYASLPF